jgi:hypothetical protein
MTTLPEALEPWRSQLDLFVPQVRVSLGHLLSRLALAIGPLSADGGGRAGEPDGYDGIDRRGSYEQLLVSEWLLAEELPEEFIRRAAEGEHAFARLAHRRPAGTRRSVALFDAGPDQLGSPRVAHLAMLLVLAARAERAGPRFGWGLIQGGTLLEEVTPATIAMMLGGRSVREATEADLLGWRKRLGAPAAPDDWWWVGGRPLARREPVENASQVRIEDLLEPGRRRLRVEVHRRSAPPRSVQLELPPAPVCVRLLRDPFAAKAAAPTRLSGGQQLRPTLLFSAKGAHLLGRLDDGSLWVQPIPNSPAASPGKPTIARLEPGEQLLAAGFDRRRACLLVRREERLLLRETGRKGGAAGPAIELDRAPAAPAGGAEGEAQLCPLITHPIGALRATGRTAVSPSGDLLDLEEGGNALACNVVAVAPFFQQLVFAAAEVPGGGDRRIQIHDGLEGHPLAVYLGHHTPFEVFFGFGGGFDDPRLRGIAAVRLNIEEWRIIHSGKEELRVSVDPGSRVVGLARDGTHGGVPALVVLSDVGRRISLAGRSTLRSLPPSGAEIVQVAVSQVEPRVAWLTSAGEVVVWSLDEDRALMRLWVGGAA